MQRPTFSLAAIALLVTIAAAACSSATPAAQQPAAPPANQQSAAVQTAPLCQNAGTCKAPTAEFFQLDCVNKVPYTNVLVPPGTKFEVLDKSGDFKCSDSGALSKGKMVITCYGRQLYGFDLKLTGAACGASNLATDTGQCQQGYGYDAAQQCCAPVSGGSSGSTTVHVDLGGCPLPRGAATPESTPGG
jgi:hypothetical protein